MLFIHCDFDELLRLLVLVRRMSERNLYGYGKKSMRRNHYCNDVSKKYY